MSAHPLAAAALGDFLPKGAAWKGERAASQEPPAARASAGEHRQHPRGQPCRDCGSWCGGLRSTPPLWSSSPDPRPQSHHERPKPQWMESPRNTGLVLRTVKATINRGSLSCRSQRDPNVLWHPGGSLQAEKGHWVTIKEI